MRLGANLDLYSNRGLLLGPSAQYIYDSGQQQMFGALNTGWIEDQGDSGDLGTDLLNQQIDSSRGFAEWRHKHHIGDRISLTTMASYWSDSEVTRDFREDYYNTNQAPDTFAEAAYAGDNYIVSAFGRFRPNDFVLTQERLPELRFDLLPVPVLDGGHLVFFSVEAILRRPLSMRTKELWQQVGLFILASLMIFVFYNDLMRIFGKS